MIFVSQIACIHHLAETFSVRTAIPTPASLTVAPKPEERKRGETAATNVPGGSRVLDSDDEQQRFYDDVIVFLVVVKAHPRFGMSRI